MSTEVKQRCGGETTSVDAHLDPSGEDSLVVEDGVADPEVEVVVLDARPHTETGLEAARTGLQQSRLREGKCWTSVRKKTKFWLNPNRKLFYYLQKKSPNQGGQESGWRGSDIMRNGILLTILAFKTTNFMQCRFEFVLKNATFLKQKASSKTFS